MPTQPTVSTDSFQTFLTVGDETVAVQSGKLRIFAYEGDTPTDASGWDLPAGSTWTFGPNVTVHYKSHLPGQPARFERIQSRRA